MPPNDALDAINALKTEIKAEYKAVSQKYDDIQEIIGETEKKGADTVSLMGHIKSQKADALRIEAKLDNMEKMMNRPNIGGGIGHKSIGQRLVESAEYKASLGDKSRGFSLEMKDITNLGNTVTGSINSLVRADMHDKIVGYSLTPTGLRDIIPVYSTESDIVNIPSVGIHTDSAAPISENALKPKSDSTFVNKQVLIQTIAHYIQVSKQAYADSKQLGAYIDVRLINGLMRQEEIQIVSGSGTAPALRGLNLPANSVAYSSAGMPGLATATKIDHIRWAMRQIGAGVTAGVYYQATGVIMNPQDSAIIDLIKDSQGRYLYSDPSSYGGTVKRILGLRVVECPAVAINASIVGDFINGAGIWEREAVNIEISTENTDNFIRNMFTVRAESRIGLGVFDANAIVRGVL